MNFKTIITVYVIYNFIKYVHGDALNAYVQDHINFAQSIWSFFINTALGYIMVGVAIIFIALLVVGIGDVVEKSLKSKS